MPVFIQQEDALDIMTSVEGEDWKKVQLDPRNAEDPWSFFGVKKAWKLCDERISAEHRANPRLMDTGIGLTHHGDWRCDGVIYGWHGYDRYTVRYSGEILFIEIQSCGPDFTKRAREAGFRFF